MKKIAVISDGRVLRPADAWAAEQVDALPRDTRLNAAITQQRSESQQGLYWAGLGYAVENIFDAEMQRKYPTARHLHKALLLHLGYYTEIPFIQIVKDEVTPQMLTAGARVLGRFPPINMIGTMMVKFLTEIYAAMHRAEPGYGMHIVEDSTRFDAMGGEEFTLFFDRVKITLLQWVERDPFEEWLQMKKDADQMRAHR